MLMYAGGTIDGVVATSSGFSVGLCGISVGFFVVGALVLCFLVVDRDVEFGHLVVALWTDEEGMIDDGVVVPTREGVRREAAMLVFCCVLVVVCSCLLEVSRGVVR